MQVAPSTDVNTWLQNPPLGQLRERMERFLLQTWEIPAGKCSPCLQEAHQTQHFVAGCLSGCRAAGLHQRQPVAVSGWSYQQQFKQHEPWIMLICISAVWCWFLSLNSRWGLQCYLQRGGPKSTVSRAFSCSFCLWLLSVIFRTVPIMVALFTASL